MAEITLRGVTRAWGSAKGVDNVDPRDRDVAMVFQSYALYPSMSIYENIRFPLRMRNVPKADQDALVRKAAAMVELGNLLERKPKALSGGHLGRASRRCRCGLRRRCASQNVAVCG